MLCVHDFILVLTLGWMLGSSYRDEELMERRAQSGTPRSLTPEPVVFPGHLADTME